MSLRCAVGKARRRITLHTSHGIAVKRCVDTPFSDPMHARFENHRGTGSGCLRDTLITCFSLRCYVRFLDATIVPVRGVFSIRHDNVLLWSLENFPRNIAQKSERTGKPSNACDISG